MLWIPGIIPVPGSPLDPVPAWLASPIGRAAERRTNIQHALPLSVSLPYPKNRTFRWALLHLLSSQGVSLRDRSTEVRWDSGGLSWHLARALLLHPCARAWLTARVQGYPDSAAHVVELYLQMLWLGHPCHALGAGTRLR